MMRRTKRLIARAPRVPNTGILARTPVSTLTNIRPATPTTTISVICFEVNFAQYWYELSQHLPSVSVQVTVGDPSFRLPFEQLIVLFFVDILSLQSRKFSELKTNTVRKMRVKCKILT